MKQEERPDCHIIAHLNRPIDECGQRRHRRVFYVDDAGRCAPVGITPFSELSRYQGPERSGKTPGYVKKVRETLLRLLGPDATERIMDGTIDTLLWMGDECPGTNDWPAYKTFERGLEFLSRSGEVTTFVRNAVSAATYAPLRLADALYGDPAGHVTFHSSFHSVNGRAWDKDEYWERLVAFFREHATADQWPRVRRRLSRARLRDAKRIGEISFANRELAEIGVLSLTSRRKMLGIVEEKLGCTVDALGALSLSKELGSD